MGRIGNWVGIGVGLGLERVGVWVRKLGLELGKVRVGEIRNKELGLGMGLELRLERVWVGIRVGEG